MKTERLSVLTCCGGTAISLKLSSPLSKDFLPLLVSGGFIEAKHFTKSGMLYIENNAITVTGNFGQNLVHIRCKINDCASFINTFEELLANME